MRIQRHFNIREWFRLLREMIPARRFFFGSRGVPQQGWVGGGEVRGGQHAGGGGGPGGPRGWGSVTPPIHNIYKHAMQKSRSSKGLKGMRALGTVSREY